MDELQLTLCNGKVYLWGISSHPEEQFVPKERLRSIWTMLFSSQDISYATIELELPTQKNIIVVSNELKLSYGQYEDEIKLVIKKILVDSIFLDFEILGNEFLLSKKM